MFAGRAVSLESVFGPTGPFRLLVTLLLVVSMPLCCCSFRSLGTCCPSQSSPVAAGHAHAESDLGHDEHASCHGGHDHGESQPDSKPCIPDDDGDGCGCGKSLTKLGVVAKPVVEVPAPALVAILPTPEMLPVEEVVYTRVRARAASPVLPPITSLLRLHCALTV